MKNLQNNELILKVFSYSYAAGILLQLYWDYFFVLGTLSSQCAEFTLIARFNSQGFYILLCLSLFLSPLLQKKWPWFWLFPALLFFVLIRSFLYCQVGPEKAYYAWNHALVFWTFFILGFQSVLGAPRTVFLLKFILIFSYFAGGIAKIRHGLDWTNGLTLQYYFLMRHMDLEIPMGWWLVADLLRAKIISWLVLTMELLTPFALLNKKIEWLFVASYFIFQILCWWLMKLKFMNYYGWSYLIYASIILVYFIERYRRSEALRRI